MVSVCRVHTYSVDPDDLEELITHRAMQPLVAALPAAGRAEAEAAMKLTRAATATNAELIDQR